MEGKENQPERTRRKIVLAQPGDRRTPSYIGLGQPQDMQQARISIRPEGSKTHRSALSMEALPDRMGRTAQRIATVGNASPAGDQHDPHHDSLSRKRHQRLAEITDRCVEYKRRFLKQLQSQMQRFDLIFKVSREQLELKFEQTMVMLQAKREELVETLQQRQNDLHEGYQLTACQVEAEVDKIVKAHQRHQQLTESDAFSDGFERDISQYAESIHHFYEKMKRIQVHAESQFTEDIFSRVAAECDQALRLRTSPEHLKSISFNNENLFVVDTASESRQNLEGIIKEQGARRSKLERLRSHPD